MNWLLNQEIEVIKALKLVWEETAANISKYHLRMMGYDINDEGSGIAIRLMRSGYNEVESASYIAMVTMALDIENAGKDMELLMSFVPHAHALLDLLKKYRDENKMNEDVWKNNSKAIFKISYLGQSLTRDRLNLQEIVTINKERFDKFHSPYDHSASSFSSSNLTEFISHKLKNLR